MSRGAPVTTSGRGTRCGPGRRANGQSTAELAMLFPIVILVVLTVVQVGLVSRDYVALHHAAREAARQVAVEPSPAAAVAAARGASPVLVPDRLAVALSGNRLSGELLTVEVDYRSPTLVPVVGRLVGDVEMSTAAVVRVE